MSSRKYLRMSLFMEHLERFVLKLESYVNQSVCFVLMSFSKMDVFNIKIKILRNKKNLLSNSTYILITQSSFFALVLETHGINADCWLCLNSFALQTPNFPCSKFDGVLQ